jgi:hypothetical protein
MSRIYTVKSNARRDCRKLGLNPDLVKEVAGGWAIDYPDPPGTKAAKPAKVAKAKAEPKAAKPKREKAPKAAKAPRPPKAAKEPRAKREGDPKKDRLIAMLADWTTLSDLMAAMEWQAHTVRGALSTAAKARGITVERRRVEGVTSYRVAGIQGQEAAE